MPNFQLIAKLRELCQSNATLLWLEGSQTERVLSVRYQSGRIVLKLGNGTNRVVSFDRFTITAVGLQFWSQGAPRSFVQMGSGRPQFLGAKPNTTRSRILTRRTAPQYCRIKNLT